MPIWLRKYTFNEIYAFYEREKEEYEKSSGREKLTQNSDFKKFDQKIPRVNLPNFVSKVKRPKK